MRLLVTGGAGFIGSNFLQLAIAGKLEIRPTSITVIDSLTYAGNKKNIENLIDSESIEFVNGDIRNESLVGKLVSNCDVLINFAAESHVDNSITNANEFIQTNIVGTQNLLNACLKQGRVRFLQVSTDEVYGSIKSGSWDENCILKPSSPYSASKAASDLLTLAMHKTHGLDAMVSRSCNNYGPMQHSEKLIPKIIMQSLSNEPLTIYGNGRNIREWIHVYDHCKALAVLIKSGQAGEIYNIGSGMEIQNIEIAKNILSLIPESDSEILFVEDRKGHDQRYSLVDSKLRNLRDMGRIVFDEGLAQTVGWYKETLSNF